jgi:hypothetical protein
LFPKIAISVVLVMVLGFGTGTAAEPEKEKAAVSAAIHWLALVDGGKYAESWSAAAAYFQVAVTESQWTQSLQSVRAPLGKLVSRKVMRKSYHTTLPGAPDGEYVVIQFQTSYENKKSAVETVTPMVDPDGEWRVSGYYIR